MEQCFLLFVLRPFGYEGLTNDFLGPSNNTPENSEGTAPERLNIKHAYYSK
jgi:hypothetical protein